ncbi:MAG: DUF1829 domain-containing protein [Anaerolineae bacterium]|nr:DUF1829 domain-containing protein [Anaerolineae bacterium]
MIHQVESLIEEYTRWLKDKTVLREVGDWIEITTPFLDRHNDYIQIYARRDNGGFILTDDSYTIEDLITSGVKLDNQRRQDLLNVTLAGFGVQRHDNALQVRATPQNFALRKHNLVQAILAVNDLFYLASPYVANLFREDVMAWLELHEVRYTPNVKFTGKSGFDYQFDFVIPKSKLEPERIVKTISRPTNDAAKAFILSWTDTREVRPSDSRAYAFLNDSEHPTQESVIDALRSYEINTVLWTQRDRVQAQLAA